jgi:hypothetical protein
MVNSLTISNVNVNGDPHTVSARGNVQNILGLYEDIDLQQNDERELSRYNSIQYVKVQSNDINACAESFHYTETGQRVTDFEFSTLAVLSPSNAFQYQSQSLETHMSLINNAPFKFRIVDQDNQPVILSMCVMEMQFYTKAYFSETVCESNNKMVNYVQHTVKPTDVTKNVRCTCTSQISNAQSTSVCT